MKKFNLTQKRKELFLDENNWTNFVRDLIINAMKESSEFESVIDLIRKIYPCFRGNAIFYTNGDGENHLDYCLIKYAYPYVYTDETKLNKNIECVYREFYFNQMDLKIWSRQLKIEKIKKEIHKIK